MDGLAGDLRFAFRTLARSPGYAAAALVTLVLGIGANAAVFGIVRSVLLAPLPYPEPERLVEVREVNARQREMQAAWRNFVDWREGSTRLEGLAAHTPGGEATVLGAGEPQRLGVAAVSRGFFRVLGVEPALGRGPLAEEHRPGADPAVVVSDGFWRSRLGGRRDLSAERLDVGGHRMRVVGVMPPGFAHPEGVDLWYPLELDGQSESRTSHNYVVVGRLAPGATLAQADAELDALTRGFREAGPGAPEAEGLSDYFPREARVVPLREALVGDTARPLWILMGASLLVLLLACANLASTALARGTARQREYAVRHAMGAGRLRLVRLAVAEALVLAGTGAAAGLLLAALALRLLPRVLPSGLPRAAGIGIDPATALFAAAAALLPAVLAGLLPGLRFSRDAVESLRAGGGGTARRGRRVWSGLVAAETALALVLLVGAGLLLRSFVSVLRVEPGFRTRGVLTATVDPPESRYPSGAERRRYYDALLARLEALPGVASAGLVAAPPLARSPNGRIDVEGGPSPATDADYQLASPGYFRAMGIPLLRGRGFGPADREDAPHAVLVNEALARVAWPGEDPVGKRVTGGGMDDYWDRGEWATVVGVVGDVRQRDLTGPARPTVYFSYRQRPFRSWSMTAVIRAARGGPAALAPAAREAVREVDPRVPVRLSTVEERVSDALSARRFVMAGIAAFAALALALACAGIYGVVAYAVERRRWEIGIRIALGAEPAAVRRRVQGDSLRAAALGGLAGVALALALSGAMEGLLFEVEPADPATFAAVLAVLGAAAWLASYLPSRRSSRVDPMESMRAE